MLSKYKLNKTKGMTKRMEKLNSPSKMKNWRHWSKSRRTANKKISPLVPKMGKRVWN